NKADREGADRSVRDLRTMLELRGHDARMVEIVKTVAATGAGVDELVQAIARHREQVRTAGDGVGTRRRKRAEATLPDVLQDRIRRAAARLRSERPEIVDQVADRTLDPYSAAEELLAQVLRE